jgi:hypothetical protein
MSFTLDINKFIEKTQANSNLVVRRTVIGILSKVVMKSPVDTGRFRANWQVGLNSAKSGSSESVDKSGSATIASGSKAIPAEAAGNAFYITNNLPYAQALEDGHSIQSPPGNMVAGTVAEFESIIREATR